LGHMPYLTTKGNEKDSKYKKRWLRCNDINHQF